MNPDDFNQQQPWQPQSQPNGPETPQPAEPQPARKRKLFGFRSGKVPLMVIGGIWYAAIAVVLVGGLLYKPPFEASAYDIMVDRAVLLMIAVLCLVMSLLASNFAWVRKIPLIGSKKTGLRVLGLVIVTFVLLGLLAFVMPKHSPEYTEAERTYNAAQEAEKQRAKEKREAEKAAKEQEEKAKREAEEAKKAEEQAAREEAKQAKKEAEEAERRAAEAERAKEGQEAEQSSEGNSSQRSKEADFVPIGYWDASYLINNYETTIKNNYSKIGPNRYGEYADEKIIYSDGYAALWCSYWAAMEERIGNPKDKDQYSFMRSERWQHDYSTDDYKNRLAQAYIDGNMKGLSNEYAAILNEDIIPAVQAEMNS